MHFIVFICVLFVVLRHILFSLSDDDTPRPPRSAPGDLSDPRVVPARKLRRKTGTRAPWKYDHEGNYHRDW